MAHHLSDGSIVSSNLAVVRKKTFYERRHRNYSIVRARIDEVVYADDPRNSTYNTQNKQVEYICTILSGTENGKRLFNVKSKSMFGGPFNFSETVHSGLTANDSSGKTKKQFAETSGEIVLIQRLNGLDEAPVIVGALKHPKSGAAATKDDGHRLLWEYNGISISINKLGEFQLLFSGGPKNEQGTPSDSEAAGASISISKDGVVSVKDSDGNGIEIDKKNKKMALTSGSGGLNVTSQGDWKVSIQGSAEIKSGSSMLVDSALIQLGSGGFQAARMNDQVFGTDAEGRPLNAWIGIGSSKVLIGG